LLPVTAGLDFTAATTGKRVNIRPPVFLAFLDQPLLDERIQVRVEAPVMDLFLVVVLEFLLDSEAVRLIEASDYLQEVALEAGQVVHRPVP
jgi:hypothetical protein